MTLNAEIRLCPACNLRYPWYEGQPARAACPRCGQRTQRRASWKLTPGQPFTPAAPPPRPLALALDNLRSAWNVGAIFRTADGLGVRHIYLGGITPTPEHPGVRKTALGAEHALPWTSVSNLSAVLADRRAAGWTIWALEQAPGSQPLTQTPPPEGPLLLIVGHEIVGVGPDLFPLCHALVHLPLRGSKRSLNVEVATAIALWQLSLSGTISA